LRATISRAGLRRTPIVMFAGFRRGCVVALVVGLVSAITATAGAQSPPAPPLTDPSGVPLGITPPVIGPMTQGAHAILAVGDSALAQGLLALPDVLARHGVVARVYDAHGNGWGLLDPLDGTSALDVLTRQLDAHPDVDTVVIGFVGVCAVACGPGKLAYGSAAFYDAWDAAARELVTTARARGVHVVWAVSPPAAPSPTDDPPTEDWFSLPMRRQVAATLVVRDRAYRKAFGVAIADWTQALSDTSGQWQSRLSYDGAVHDVRLDDAVHLTKDGSERTSLWTASTLAQVWRPTRPARRAQSRDHVTKG